MDKNLLPPLIGALSGAFVAAVGWFVLHGLSARRESAARRDHAARSYLEKQIEELYGPLLGLIVHSRTAFAVATRKLPHTASGQIDFGRFAEGDGAIWHFFIEQYFLPVNAEIRRLLRSKMHLLESGMIPRSFEDFFLHEVQFEALHTLWQAHGVDSLTISGPGWPSEFEADVRTVLEQLRARHQVFLRRTGATQ
jgi:hypothetical protein